MRIVWLLSLLASGCALNHTLLVTVRNPSEVEVRSAHDGQRLPVATEGGESTPISLSSEVPTGAFSATGAHIEVERDATGAIHERWTAPMSFAQGEYLHIVDHNGALPPLPPSLPLRTGEDGWLEIPIAHRLTPHAVRGGTQGVDIELVDPRTHAPNPLDLVLRTPKSNVVRVERLADPSYRAFAFVMVPGTIVAAIGSGLIASTHANGWNRGVYAVGAMVAGAGLSVDVFGIYALAAGGRRRAVALP